VVSSRIIHNLSISARLARFILILVVLAFITNYAAWNCFLSDLSYYYILVIIHSRLDLFRVLPCVDLLRLHSSDLYRSAHTSADLADWNNFYRTSSWYTSGNDSTIRSIHLLSIVNQQVRLAGMPRYRPGSHVCRAQGWRPIFASTHFCHAWCDPKTKSLLYRLVIPKDNIHVESIKF
jgi:hypothetical protein